MPKTYKTNFTSKENILSVGTQQKNTISVYQNSQITTSVYNGDLLSIQSINCYEKSIETFKNFYDFQPTLLVCDKHPNYIPTIWAKKQNLPKIEVLHHYAHILAVMFEHNIKEEVLGISWDGTGFGEDGTIWGGEFFLCDYRKYKRVLSFKPFKLLGGEKSIKNIDRVLFSILYENKNDMCVKKYLEENFDRDEFLLLSQSYEKEINTHKCSSVGRVFDAVCSLALNKKSVSYDGESGLNLEMLYEKKIVASYDYFVNRESQIEYSHWFTKMVEEKPKEIASKFINTLVKIIVDTAKQHRKKVILCGGVFQNKTLLSECIKAFKREKIRYFIPKEHSVNDSNISLGGLVYTLHNKK
jgi:hydrogenase maturation protein HypF